MTKTIFQNWKVLVGLSIAAVLLGGAFSFGLFTPKAEATEHIIIIDGSTPTACLPEEVRHWDKIIFENKKDILKQDGTLAVEKGTIMDIKVLDNPASIEFPLQKAAARLNQPMWTNDKGEFITVNDLKLIDVEYAIVCVSSNVFPNGGNNES